MESTILNVKSTEKISTVRLHPSVESTVEYNEKRWIPPVESTVGPTVDPTVGSTKLFLTGRSIVFDESKNVE